MIHCCFGWENGLHTILKNFKSLSRIKRDFKEKINEIGGQYLTSKYCCIFKGELSSSHCSHSYNFPENNTIQPDV